jgi:CubicO group peptidase (beta-lactamase class C family)
MGAVAVDQRVKAFRQSWAPFCFFLAFCATSVWAAAGPVRKGFDLERLKRLDDVIQRSVDEEKLAGAVMLILREGETAHLQSYGWADRDAKRPMTPDTIMRIASMSKAITTVAALILYEEGHFLLRDPISNYLPAFSKPVVAVASADGKSFTTEPARRPIRVIDLMRHTAGLTYGDGPAKALYEQAKLTGWYLAGHDETIAQVVDRLATLPLHGQPGERYQYGYSTDVLGRYVEAVSGETLDQFLARRIFEPLGMKDTHFFLPPEKADRLAPVYGYSGGKLVLNETTAKTEYLHGPRKCFGGGAGLLSTTTDYARFLQMLLNDGELEGVRILSPQTVALMRADHHVPGYDWDTKRFGLGFWVLADRGLYGEIGSVGSYGWGSAYYPQYLVDPEKRLVAMLMTQLRPAPSFDLNQRFKVLMYQALVD